MGYGYLVRLDVFTAGRGKKVCTIYDSNGEQLGAAHNIERLREMAGWKQISFDIPIQYNGEMNWRVQYMTPEYEIRVTDGSEVDWFRITEPTESDTGTKSELHVVCPHISTILKKRNIYMAFDDTNGIGTLVELVGRALEGTGWGIGTADTIYETDGVTEKIRTYNCDEKTGAFAMVQEICQKFGAYPEFNGDQQLVDLWDRKKHRRMLEMGIDKNLVKISRTRNTDDIITRLYVEGEYGDDGYVGIDDVNPTHLSFLLNFEYYRSIGALTPEKDQAQQTYMSEMLRLKLAIMEKSAALESNQTALELNWGNQGYVIWSVINGAYSPTVVYGGGATTADNITIGDTVAFVGGGGDYEYGTFSSLTPPSEKLWAVKFLRPCGGALGGKEIAVEAKNETLQTLNEKLAQYTEDQVQERESLITQIQQTTAEIAVIRNGTETDVGQWALMLSCINLTGQIVQNESQLVALQNEQKTTETTFSDAMGSLLQDGYFNDSTYGVGQEEALYNDSYEILNALSKPQLSYELSEIDLANTPGYTDEIYYMNSAVHFYNPRIGVNDYGFVTQITEDLDIANTRRVKIETDELNIQGKTFGTMMGRIVNAAQNLVDNKSIYARAAAIGADGTLGAEKLDGIIDVLQNRLESTQSNWYTDDNGNIIFESADGTNAMMLCGSGFMVANGKTDAGRWNWRTFGTGEGFTADLITAGILRAGLITILGSEQFYWNDQNIYVINPEDTDQQIRIGKYDGEHLGIGYTNDGGETWFSAISFDGVHLSAEDEIKLNAGVGGTNLVQIADGLVTVGNGSVERDLSDEYYRHSLTEYIMAPFSSSYNYVTFDDKTGYEIQIAPGDYTLSFWCKADTANDGRVITPDLFSATTQLPFESITPTTEWTHYKLTLHNESTVDSVALRLMSFTPWATGNVHFSDVKLETGIKDTAWSPNPEEFQAGSVLRMNKDGTYIATPEFEVDINGSTEFMRIDENGMVTDHMTAQDSVTAPNVAEKYDGSPVIYLGGTGSNEEQVVYNTDFDPWYNGHYLDGNAAVTASSSWDICRYPFTQRMNITLLSITNGGASNAFKIGYELNSTYHTATPNQTFDADALVINRSISRPSTQKNLLPDMFEADGDILSGRVIVAENGVLVIKNLDNWDILRVVHKGRIRAITINTQGAAQGVIPIAYEKDGVMAQLVVDSIWHDIDALYINCLKGSTISGGTWTSSTLTNNFSEWYKNYRLMESNGVLTGEEASDYNLYHYAFGRTRKFKVSSITKNTSSMFTGTMTIGYQLGGTYYNLPINDTSTIYDADEIIINTKNTTVATWNNITYNKMAFILYRAGMGMVGNGDSTVHLQVTDQYDVYRYAFDQKTTFKFSSFTNDDVATMQGIILAAYEKNGTLYNIDLTNTTIEYTNADAILINRRKIPGSAVDTVITPSNFTSDMDNIYLGPNGLEPLTAWHMYKYTPASNTIRVVGMTPNDNVSGAIRMGYFDTATTSYLPLYESDVGKVITTNSLKLNYFKPDSAYAITSFRYAKNADQYYYSVKSITLSIKSTQTITSKSATAVTLSLYNDDGAIVDTRTYSINNVVYYEQDDPTYAYSADMAKYRINRTLYGNADQYDTITELADVINNKVATQDIIINMAQSVYGDVWLGGMSGIGGLTMNGNGYSLVSNISMYNQNVPVTFNNIVFNGSIGLNSCKYVTFNNCILNGSTAVALFLGGGTVASLNNCKLFNSNTLINAQSGSTLITQELTGGDSAKNFLTGAFSHIMMNGTRPEGTVSLLACLSNPEDPSSLPTGSGGTPPAPSTPTTTLTFAATTTRTYHQVAWTNDTIIRQGIMGMSNGNMIQSGCIWFDLSSLTGTVQNATLTLTRKAGYGISGEVQVDLYGTKATDMGANPTSSANKVSFGSDAKIGTIANGETKTFTIPTAAVTQLKNGTIKGLMLQVSDTSVRSGKGYSTNYAIFYGIESTAYLPVLTVVTG